MNKKLKLFTEGKVTTKDRSYTRLIGGFGEGKPMFMIWQASDLLGIDSREVTQNFERNASNFDKGIDFINLKSAITGNDSENNVDITKFLKEVGYSQSRLNATKNWLAFSFSGMMKLVKIAKSEESWNIYNEFLEDYFRLRAENESMKQTIEEEIKNLQNERFKLLGLASYNPIECERVQAQKEAENLNNKIIKLHSAKDNDKIREALEKQARLSESKSVYLNQTEFGERYNNKIGSKTVGKLLKIVGLAKKSNNDNGRTVPYQQFVPDYAVNVKNNNKELDYDIAYRWNFNKCAKRINQWLLDNDYHDEFYGITDKDEMVRFVDELYHTYMNRNEKEVSSF